MIALILLGKLGLQGVQELRTEIAEGFIFIRLPNYWSLPLQEISNMSLDEHHLLNEGKFLFLGSYPFRRHCSLRAAARALDAPPPTLHRIRIETCRWSGVVEVVRARSWGLRFQPHHMVELSLTPGVHVPLFYCPLFIPSSILNAALSIKGSLLFFFLAILLNPYWVITVFFFFSSIFKVVRMVLHEGVSCV